MDELHADRINDITTITYHAWWPSYFDPFWQADSLENRGRINYYGVTGTPTLKIDGVLTGASIGGWSGQIDSRLAVDAPVTIDVSTTYNPGPRTGTFTATVTNVSGAAINGNLRVAITESEIHFAAPNGLQVHNFTMRDMLPNEVGSAVSLGAGGAQTYNLPYTLNPAWDEDHVQIVATVQRPAPVGGGNRESYQAARLFYPFDQPYLSVGGAQGIAPPGGDGDAFIDPGEAGQLVVTLANLNPAAATGTTGTLTSSDPFITMVDGSTTFGTVPGFGTASHAGDPFSFTVGAGAPRGYEAQFTLTVNAGTLAYTKVLTTSVDVGSPTDYTGPAGVYYAYENADVGFTETPVYSWTEIDPGLGGAGTLIPLSDDQVQFFRLPFTFRWYGVNYDTVTVSSNGWIAMGRQFGSDDNSPSDIPDADGPFSMIAGMWDDLNPAAAGSGKVFRYSDVVNHRFIIEWNGVEHYDPGSAGLPEWFQIVLLDPAFNPTINGDGEALVVYKDVNDPGSVVAGMENPAETIGIEYSFFGDANPAAVGLADQRVVKYTPDVPASGVPSSHAGAGPTLLMAASPNPFARSTEIAFRLASQQNVSLEVYGVDGRRVATLFDGVAEAGVTSTRWNGLDSEGRVAAAGIYFARLSTREETQSIKVMVLR